MHVNNTLLQEWLLFRLLVAMQGHKSSTFYIKCQLNLAECYHIGYIGPATDHPQCSIYLPGQSNIRYIISLLNSLVIIFSPFVPNKSIHVLHNIDNILVQCTPQGGHQEDSQEMHWHLTGHRQITINTPFSW